MNESEVHSRLRILEDPEENTPEQDPIVRDGGFEIEKVGCLISARVEKRVLVQEDGWTVDSDTGLYQCWATILWPHNALKIDKGSPLSDILEHPKLSNFIATLPFWTDGGDVWQVRPVSVIWTKEHTSKWLWNIVFNDEDKGFIRRVIAGFGTSKIEVPSGRNAVIDRFGRFIIS